MQLIINLDEISTYDDYKVSELINDAIKSEIDRFVRMLVKDVLKEQEKQVRAAVKKAAEKDWRRVAQALESLNGKSA